MSILIDVPFDTESGATSAGLPRSISMTRRRSAVPESPTLISADHCRECGLPHVVEQVTGMLVRQATYVIEQQVLLARVAGTLVRLAAGDNPLRACLVLSRPLALALDDEDRLRVGQRSYRILGFYPSDDGRPLELVLTLETDPVAHP